MDTPDLTTLKRCTKCGELKPRDQFCKQTNSKDGARSWCRACDREYRIANAEHRHRKAREYDAMNAERKAEYRAANAERKAEYDRRYRDANIDRITEYLAVNADHVKERKRKYRQSPHGRSIVNTAQQRRRARKLSLLDTFTASEWQFALDHFGGCCAVCGRPPGLWHILAADHWIPLDKGGATTPDNIVPLCHGVGGCNNSKRHRDATEWVISKFGKRKGKMILKRIESYLQSRQLGIEE